MTGGVMALVTARLLGARRGKYNKDGSANAIPGHNIPMAMIGTFILCFGWFGFNAGSTLAGTDTQLAVAAVNTMLASASGAFAAYVFTSWKFGKPDPSWLANGMLAGLVAITAPCAFVDSWAALLIGAIAGVLVVAAALFIDTRLKIDDPVGAIAVHGVNGAWGVLALGLFANGKYGADLNGVKGMVSGLFYGNAGQFLAEVIGVIANLVYVGSVGGLAFWLLGKVVKMRPTAEEEVAGLDMSEMGVYGYSDDAGPVAVK
jgi:Amt family ammonium transporter